VDAITAALWAAKDQALRDLLSRVVKAASLLQREEAQHREETERQRLRGKREGLNLVRSYIEEELRVHADD